MRHGFESDSGQIHGRGGGRAKQACECRSNLTVSYRTGEGPCTREKKKKEREERASPSRERRRRKKKSLTLRGEKLQDSFPIDWDYHITSHTDNFTLLSSVHSRVY